jgi:hypothetical protein
VRIGAEIYMLRSPGFATLLLVALGCGSEPEPVTLRGHTDECALVVFESSAGNEELSNLLEQHTTINAEDGKSFWHREGIRSVIKRGYDSKEAYEVCFEPDASAALRNSIVHDMSRSPGVEEVRRIAIDPSTGTPLREPDSKW